MSVKKNPANLELFVDDNFSLRGIKKDISIKEINDYEEIILIGSGKGVTSVSKIDELKWKSRNNVSFNKLDKIYNTLI